MKKITFVEKDDDSSYDPVNTFFSKNKGSSVAKPSNNTSKQTSSIKTPIQKSMQAKRQKSNQVQQAKQSLPQKIGQKGGSGYIPKKAPVFSSTSYQTLKEQTIYDLKQKQTQSRQNKRTFTDKANSTKNNFNVEKKPDMVFDVPKLHYEDEEDEREEESKHMNENPFEKQINEEPNFYESKNKLPEIKSPNNIPKIMNLVDSIQKPPVPKFENNVKKVYKPTIKDQFFAKKSQQGELSRPKDDSSEIKIKIKQEPSTTKKVPQASKLKPPSSLQKPNSTKQISNPPLNKQQSRQQSQQLSAQTKQKPNNNLQQRIKELESYQKQYTQKIQHLQQRIEGLTKIQQKYNKISKQHKLCQQKSKAFTQISQQLASTKQSIQKFLSQTKVPYSKKRQYLLLNQINQLKKTNSQLVLRIKSYKGTDLMEMSISKNKEEIGREFEIDYQEQYNKMNTEIQSQLSIFIGKVYEYLDIKSGKSKKTTKEEISFDKEQKFLLELNSIAQKVSLTYLEKYEVSPMPTSNEQCMNLYAEIEKQKANIFRFVNMSQLMNKEELNFAITQTNLQIINDLQQNVEQMNSLQQKILTQLKPDQKQKPSNRPVTSSGTQNKNTNKILLKKVSYFVQLFKRRSFISTAFHIQSICYFTFLKEFIEKKLRKLQKELVNLYGRLREMKDIYDLGGNTAKQSLYLYLGTNLQNFTLVVPNLQCDIKQLRSSYHQISKGLERAMHIKQL